MRVRVEGDKGEGKGEGEGEGEGFRAMRTGTALMERPSSRWLDAAAAVSRSGATAARTTE